MSGSIKALNRHPDASVLLVLIVPCLQAQEVGPLTRKPPPCNRPSFGETQKIQRVDQSPCLGNSRIGDC